MENNDTDKSSMQKIVIKTKQGDVEISWSRDQRPGFCPHCHKCIPFNSIVFKKENQNDVETYSGMDAVRTKKHDRFEEGLENNSQIGECPYCHMSIPMREILFKKTVDEKQ